MSLVGERRSLARPTTPGTRVDCVDTPADPARRIRRRLRTKAPPARTCCDARRPPSSPPRPCFIARRITPARRATSVLRRLAATPSPRPPSPLRRATPARSSSDGPARPDFWRRRRPAHRSVALPVTPSVLSKTLSVAHATLHVSPGVGEPRADSPSASPSRRPHPARGLVPPDGVRHRLGRNI